jgi:DNA-binding LacI/PurR family transcriptional regulator
MMNKQEIRDGLASLVEWLTAEMSRLDGPMRLPSERELAERFGVSRRHVRSELTVLEQRSQLIRKHGSGSYLYPERLRLDEVILIACRVKSDDPFLGALMAELTSQAAEKGIRLRPITPLASATHALATQSPRRPTAPVLVIGRLTEEERDGLKGLLDRSVVLVDGGASSGCVINYDDVWIGSQAARQVAAMGHRNVLLLCGPTKYASSSDRERGFMLEAATHSMQVVRMYGTMNCRAGFDAVREYLKLQQSQPVATAIVAANDWMAVGAMQAVLADGRRVGDDISVIGCDDVPLASQWQPGLATFRLDVGQYVQQTYATLEQAVRYNIPLPRRIVLPVTFVPRPSLAPAPITWPGM